MKIDKADGIIVEITHEQIIDQYTFDRVKELMKLRTKSSLTTGKVYVTIVTPIPPILTMPAPSAPLPSMRFKRRFCKQYRTIRTCTRF